MTLKLEIEEEGVSVIIALVYAKYTQNKRLLLWKSLGDMALFLKDPWLVGVDFSIIRAGEEKFRGLPDSIDEI